MLLTGKATLLSLLIKHLHRLFIDLYFVSAMPEIRFYRYGFEAIGVIGSVVRIPKLRRFLIARELVWNGINLLQLVAYNIFAPNRSCSLLDLFQDPIGVI